MILNEILYPKGGEVIGFYILAGFPFPEACLGMAMVLTWMKTYHDGCDRMATARIFFAW